jgi:hypothetical protein
LPLGESEAMVVKAWATMALFDMLRCFAVPTAASLTSCCCCAVEPAPRALLLARATRWSPARKPIADAINHEVVEVISDSLSDVTIQTSQHTTHHHHHHHHQHHHLHSGREIHILMLLYTVIPQNKKINKKKSSPACACSPAPLCQTVRGLQLPSFR